jgi:hypothetical protein
MASNQSSSDVIEEPLGKRILKLFGFHDSASEGEEELRLGATEDDKRQNFKSGKSDATD